MWDGGSAAYQASTLEPTRIRNYAKKVARQAKVAGLAYIPASKPDPVWLVGVAPFEGSRAVRCIGNKEYISLDHEGNLIGLRPDGTLVSDMYGYGKSWEVGQSPETFDEDKIQPLSRSEFQFNPLNDGMLMYLDVGRDRWHRVSVPRGGSVRNREELNTKGLRPIVHAKGVGMSRALRDLYVRAGG